MRKSNASLWGVFLSVAMVLILGCATFAQAESAAVEQALLQMKAQIEQLQSRLEAQEQRNAELEQRLQMQEKTTAEQGETITQVKQTAVDPGKHSVRTKYPVDLYGYIKLDAAYDTSRTDTGNFARWVLPEGDNKNDRQFNITANQSRFGLNFNGPEFGNAITRGKVEVDFYGGGAENKANIQLRHAYLEMLWHEYDFSILAGQTSDVISPLNPPTVNYSVAWWAGNIGHRHPQLRLTKGLDLGSDSKLLLQGAVSRTIGDAWGFHPGDTGEDAGFPTLQGRVAYSFPLLTSKPTTLGISGHWGQEEYDYDVQGLSKKFDTWSLNLDLTLPLAQRLTLLGELWTGENLDDYSGGIGQGVNRTTLEEIAAWGGWAALSVNPWDCWTFNVGASLDNPRKRDLNPGDRSRNTSVFGNVMYDINPAVQLGLELSYWETEYKDNSDGDDIRLQTSLTYKF